MFTSVTDHMKMMHTQMSLHPDEFDHFELGEDSDITFCLKELRVTGFSREARCVLTRENKCVRTWITSACEPSSAMFLVQLDQRIVSSAGNTLTYVIWMPSQSKSGSVYRELESHSLHGQFTFPSSPCNRVVCSEIWTAFGVNLVRKIYINASRL